MRLDVLWLFMMKLLNSTEYLEVYHNYQHNVITNPHKATKLFDRTANKRKYQLSRPDEVGTFLELPPPALHGDLSVSVIAPGALIDKSSLHLIEIIDYDRSYNEEYLNDLILKAKPSWEGVGDADEWLSQLR